MSDGTGSATKEYERQEWERLAQEELEKCVGQPLKQLQPYPPYLMMTFQPLPDAVDEFIVAVRKLQAELKLPLEVACDLVIQLKRLGVPREVK